MKDRGEILQDVIKKKGISLSEVGRRLGIDRSTVYRHTKNANLDDATLLQYGKALNYDFSMEIPELYNSMKLVNEPSPEYRNKTYDELLIERDYYKDKYINLLEKYNVLVEDRLEKKA